MKDPVVPLKPEGAVPAACSQRGQPPVTGKLLREIIIVRLTERVLLMIK